jgi:hypothetical protein
MCSPSSGASGKAVRLLPPYTRGSKKNPVPDRFDYLLASPEFSIREVVYDYEGGCAAGSDHAFVRAGLLLA